MPWKVCTYPSYSADDTFFLSFKLDSKTLHLGHGQRAVDTLRSRRV